MINFDERFGTEQLQDFAEILTEMSDNIGMKVSARGWCYLMEQAGHITKAQFDKVETVINKARREGILPVDFVAEEDARAFSGVMTPSDETLQELLIRMLEDVLMGHRYFTPALWEDEEYYIQVLVEKVDLKTMWERVCSDYAIPIANAKGWSSILQRAEYARRFKEAESKGLKCVLLYCGDHDPDGLRISATLRNNLEQVMYVTWGDGDTGYDPSDLIIERFGLNYDFILDHGFTWIDNLITGSKKNLADPHHRNNKLPYVKDYLRKIGARKCEANVLVTSPKVAEKLMREAIEKYLGKGAVKRFRDKTKKVVDEYEQILIDREIYNPIRRLIDDQEE